MYRDLGLPVRAKEIAEGLYRTAPEDRYKHAAASLLSHLVAEIGLGEDEEEAWLKRGDATQPEVKHLLLRLEARRLARQGKLAEADRAYARLAADYERDAGHDAVAANNAAVAYQDRYTTTGDPAHLRAAVKQLEAAHRLSPQSAMVAGNLANALEQLAEVTVLDRWVKTRSLALDSGETEIVLSAILAGPLREQALADIHRDPSFQRSLDVGAEEQVLAPGSAGAYSRQVRWLVRSDDDKALVEMQRRLAALPPFDAASLAESRRAFRDRAHDAMNKAMIAERVARAEERVQRVERAGHAPTLSAANLVLSVDRGWLTMLDRSPGNVDAMVETARKAAEGWPEGGADRGLPGTLLRAAIFRAVPEEMAMAKAVEADGRDYSDAMLVARALNGPEGAAVLSALRRRPELAEAARLCRLHVRERPGISDVVLARAADDAELEAAASASFDRASLGAELAIDAILAPGQPTEAYPLDFWRTRGARR